ncbi:MAG TPA: hypothetical protein VM241_03020 [Candidatus Thermoplasmatota archaeon]|nr:hypothetical protein [Candidatus Thermoplasmatota archaeon]
MVVRRLAATTLLLALVVGVAWWLQDGPVPAPSGDGPHQVQVLGPGATPFWDGTVVLPGNATALSALQAAAQAGNFTITVQHSFAPWVTRIGPYAQDATGGWNFCVGDGKAWSWVASAADARRLATHEAVRWVWVTDGGNGCTAQ